MMRALPGAVAVAACMLLSHGPVRAQDPGAESAPPTSPDAPIASDTQAQPESGPSSASPGAAPSTSDAAPASNPASPPGDETASKDPSPVAGRKPAPWVKAPIILGIQVIAGVGARSLVVPLLLVPGVGLLAMLAQPVLEAMAITWAGDRLGDGRSALVWPLLVSVAMATVSNALLVVGTLLAGAALLTTLVGQLPGVTVSPPLLLGILWFGVGLSLVAAAMVMLSNLLGILSPVASTAIYQALKRRKPSEDNGAQGPGLFSPGGPKPAPPPPEAR